MWLQFIQRAFDELTPEAIAAVFRSPLLFVAWQSSGARTKNLLSAFLCDFYR
jgi:hypothetical protein